MKYLFHEQLKYRSLHKALLIMRLAIVFSLICMLQANAKGIAQMVTLNVSRVPLEKVCKEIEKQTGYYFVYAKDFNKKDYLVSAQVQKVSIDKAMHLILKGLPFTYQLIDKVIVINSIYGNDKTVSDTIFNQSENGTKIEGVVLSEQGQPLSGASVTVKSTHKGVLTSVKGTFVFKSLPLNTELDISFIGYNTKSVIAKEVYLQIRLSLATNNLDASVVKGYYNTTNRLNTGNVSVVKGEDIAKQPVTDPLLALEGRVPGLYINQATGIPGANNVIQLRGINSLINGNRPLTQNDPLFIIDGIPYSSASLSNPFSNSGAVGSPGVSRSNGLSPFNGLNPLDIESIEVLKDADATAIYGSRGSNGVILITTKKGKIGQTKIDADVYTGITKITRTINMLNTQQYLAVRREAHANDGTIPDSNYEYDLTYWDTTRYTDWQKTLIGGTGHFTNAQISMSGGNANTQFLISGGYSNQGTVFPGNYADKKASVHFNLNHTSSNQKFQVQFTGGYVNDNSNLPLVDFTNNITLAPNAPALYDANGNLNWQVKGGTSTWTNPLAQTNNDVKATTDNLISNLTLSYQLFRGAQILSSFGYTHTQTNQIALGRSTSYGPPSNVDPSLRGIGFGLNDSKAWIIEPQVSFHRQIGSMIINSLIGTTFQENILQANGFGGSGFSSDALVSNPAFASTISLIGYSYSQYRYNAVFGRLNFNWQEKYLLNLTGRRDGSSRFGPNRQFGNFGAIGAGWIFSKETVIQDDLSWLSFGKIRASYGITGSDQLNDYQYLDNYSSYTSSTYQGLTGLAPTGLTNPYYSWEKDKKFEIGLEIGLIKDKILFTSSYYRNRVGNQLVGYPLPLTTGFSSVQYNLPALLQNTGIELTLNTINYKVKNFSWTSSLNLSIPRNKLVKFPGIQSSSYKYSYSIGKSLSSRYKYHYTGIDPETGIYTFATQKGSGTPQFGIDNYFTRPIAQDYYGGFQNQFRYKGFQLDVFFQFVKQLGYNYLNAFLNAPGLSPNYNEPTVVLNRWRKPGDQASTQKYTANYSDYYISYSNLMQSDAVISDASFVRLKNLAFSYQFSSEWCKKATLQNVTIYVQCQNLLTITKYSVLDPETQGLGLPPLRVITAGLRLTL